MTDAFGAAVVMAAVTDVDKAAHHEVATELEKLFQGKKKEDIKEFYNLMIERVKRDHGLPYKSSEAAYKHWQNGGDFFSFRSGDTNNKGLTFDVIVASAINLEISGNKYMRGYAFHLIRAGISADEILGKAKTLLG